MKLNRCRVDGVVTAARALYARWYALYVACVWLTCRCMAVCVFLCPFRPRPCPTRLRCAPPPQWWPRSMLQSSTCERWRRTSARPASSLRWAGNCRGVSCLPPHRRPAALKEPTRATCRCSSASSRGTCATPTLVSMPLYFKNNSYRLTNFVPYMW